MWSWCALWVVAVLSVAGLLPVPAWAEPQPGETFRDCPECPHMVVVPAGTFLMGSPSNEEGRDSNEGPQHEVTFAKPFAVGVYEVTFAEWDACISGGGCRDIRGNVVRPDDAGWGRGQRPVINVNWQDAWRYARWVSQRTGKNYRLLSEAEWEYVARAGTTSPFHTGWSIGADQANYSGSGKKRTVPVGSYAPNAFGLYDVHGNVWEWTQDCRNENYEGAPNDGRAWESGDCSRRVLRGGSWISFPGALRSANRGGFTSDFRFDYNGFRLARSLP